MVALGFAGAFGFLEPNGGWLGVLGTLAVGWMVWRHRWPAAVPLRLKTFEAPQGPDERGVMVVFRQEGTLLGWDAGILWFERSGVGFVGQTVSFVLPRATMERQPTPPIEAIVRVPRLVAKVGETTVGFVPLAGSMSAQMTLARLDALPTDSRTSEMILPPVTLHPDLLQRGLAVRRRLPWIGGLAFVLILLAPAMNLVDRHPRGPLHLIFALMPLFGFVFLMAQSAMLPRSIRERLPNEPRRRRHPT